MSAIDDTQVFAQAPCEPLRAFIKRFLIVESAVAHRDVHLPDTGFVAAFSFRGDCRLNDGAQAPRAAITGLWDTTRTHFHNRGHAVVIASFTTTGAAAFLRQPLEEFANVTTDLDDALGHSTGLDCLQDRLAAAAHHAHRIHLLERFLIDRCGDARPDPLVAAAVELIARTHGTMRIEDIVRRVGLSQSALERRFRRHVGTSPRKLASLVRLRHVVRLRETGADLTTIAHGAGYSDQAHFIKDFKRFTGRSPRSYFGA